MNIGALLARHARFRPDHLAVVFRDQRLTFRELNTRVNRLANALLAVDIGKGDSVATLLPNCLPLLETYWAVAKIGAVAVPLSPLLQEAGISALLANSDARLVIATSAFADTLDRLRAQLPAIASDRYVLVDGVARAGFRRWQEWVGAAPASDPPDAEITDADPYNIIYSSGTTGEPKGIVHTHYVRAMYCTMFASAFRMTPESVVLHAGALVFNGAFLDLMPAMFLGCTYILHPAFDAEAVIADIARAHVTHMIMVPSQIVAMLASPSFTPTALQSLEMILSVGAPLHLEHKRRLNEALPGRFYELYGLTEGFVTVLDRADAARKTSSVGVPPPLVEMRILDEAGRDVGPGEIGEICGRGPLLMAGYYKRPDLTARAIPDGWLRSGDLGYVDEDGFLYLVDRKKDMIISGGVNVYPRDVEEVAVRHAAVREAAVFGVPDARWGETPVAAVVLTAPGAARPAELMEWINSRVSARYQRVSDVVILEDFPRNVAGKTLKRVLQERYRGPAGTL